MRQMNRKLGVALFAFLAIVAGQTAHARACVIGECSAMTTEFRNLELRPKTIALLPPISTLIEKGIMNDSDKTSETALLESVLTQKLEKEISSRGYDVRVLTFDEINNDAQLSSLVNEANTRFDEEYSKIQTFKVSGVKYRRYSVGDKGRMLANYLGVDAVAFPRMEAQGASGAAKLVKAIGSGGDTTYIAMEFGLVHARTGDLEGFFGAIKYGSMFGTSLKKILDKPDKFMGDVAKTSIKKLPKAGQALSPEKLKETPNELVLYDPVDEDALLDDLEGLLDEE